MARSQIPSEERVFSLVLALVASTNGLTKHELLSSVYGYAGRASATAHNAALDRQFERDKEQLRSLGIPVETIESPGEPGNNQLSRYRIQKTALEVPQGLEFSDRELMLLRMAALAWREGSLTAEAHRAAMKLESLGARVDAPRLGVSAGFGATEPAAPALLHAIDESAVAEFAYQLADRESPLIRRVLPLQLHRFEGRWHLVAFDLDREATRVFLLSRIVGSVAVRASKPDESTLPASTAQLVDRAIDDLRELTLRQRVTIKVRAGSIADTVLASRADSVENVGDGAAVASKLIEFGTADFRELAPEIAGFGADALVIQPPKLRELVIARLESVLDAHRGEIAGGVR